MQRFLKLKFLKHFIKRNYWLFLLMFLLILVYFAIIVWKPKSFYDSFVVFPLYSMDFFSNNDSTPTLAKNRNIDLHLLNGIKRKLATKTQHKNKFVNPFMLFDGHLDTLQ